MDIKCYIFLKDAIDVGDCQSDYLGEYCLKRTKHLLRVTGVDKSTGCDCFFDYSVYERPGKSLPPSGIVMDWDGDVVCLGTDFGYRIISKETGKIITECSL